MKTNFDIKTIKKELPHGSIGIISERSGFSRNMISKIINGDTKSPQYPEIIKAIAEYLSEYKAKKEEALQSMTAVLETAE